MALNYTKIYLVTDFSFTFTVCSKPTSLTLLSIHYKTDKICHHKHKKYSGVNDFQKSTLTLHNTKVKLKEISV